MKRATLFGLFGWLAFMVASPLIAQPFTYQGFLRQNGQPVTNNALQMTFRLFTALTGGSQLGSAITQTVNVQNGLFTVELNFGTVWTGADRFLEIQVGSTVLSPRVRITPAPYASFAASADFAQRPWQTSGSTIFYTDGNVGIGTNSPFARLSLGGGEANTKLAIWQGANAGEVMGLGVGPNQFRLHLHNSSNRFSFLSAPVGSELMTILGTGNVGIGTISPADRLHIVGNLRVDNGSIRSWGPITLHPDVDNTGDDVVRFVDSTGNETMRIHSDGRVGIGTSSPAERLHVIGNIRLADDSSIFGLDRLVGFNDLRLFGDATGGPDLYISAAGNVGIGTSSPPVRLSLGGDNANTKLAIWHDTSASDAMGLGVGPAQFRLHLHNSSNRFSFLSAPAGNELMTIQGNGNVGIGITTPGFPLHVKGSAEFTVFAENTKTSFPATGIIGTSGAGHGVYGYSTAPSGETYGVFGVSNSPDGAGVAGWASSNSGSGYGVYAVSNGNSGAGLVGIGNNTETLAIYALAPRLGMRIYATEARIGYTSAIEAYSYATGTYTIYGYSGSAVGTPVTVYAHNSSPTGAAVFTVGNVVVGGAKAFRIDHPLYPATHYLNHFCTEGPDPYNAYSGIVTLDSNGEAWVQLPDYFEAANRDPRYTLTPVGAPMPNLHIVVEVQNNRFKIAGGAPGKKVSWRIEAIRNDPTIHWSGYQTEQEKPAHEQGKYLRPEAYGLPREMGISPLPPQPLPSRNLVDSDTKK